MPRERKPPPVDADPLPKFPKCQCGAVQGVIYKPDYFAWCCDACGNEGKPWKYPERDMAPVRRIGAAVAKVQEGGHGV